MPIKTTRKYINLSVDELTIGNGAFTLPIIDGTIGQSLITDGAGNVTWQTPAGGGTVTSITAGVGLNGGTITGSGTIDLANTTVVPGSYTNADITIDAQGRITAAANGSGGGGLPAGSDTEIQFNNSGAFGASSALTWDGNEFSIKPGIASIVTSSTLTSLTIQQSGTGDIVKILDGTTVVFSIKDGGNVGVGTLIPTNLLDIDGDLRVRTISNATGDFATLDANGVLQKRTAAQVLTDIGAVGGSGTNNYVARWTPSGNLLGDSLIQDNGTTLGINAIPVSNTHIYAENSTENGFIHRNTLGGYAISGTTVGASAISGQSIGVSGTGSGSPVNFGGTFGATGSTGIFGTGVSAVASIIGATRNVGISATALNGTDNYSAWLKDGTEGTGKFLKSVTSDGKANWADIVTTDIVGVSATNGVLYSASTWTDNADGTLTLPDVDVVLYDDQNWTGVAGVYTVTGGTTGTDFAALTDESTNYIYLDYNSGTPQWVITTSEPDYDRSDRAKYITLYRAGTFLHILDWDFEASGLSNKLLQRVYEINKIQRATGLAISAGGNDPLQVNIAAGDIWNGIHREITLDINSWDDILFSNYHTAGVWDRTVTGPGAGIANNLYYDNGTNRVALGTSKYVVNWYYKGAEAEDHVYEVLGRGEYDTVAEAQLETAPPIPELVESHAILVGRIICQEGNGSPATIESAFDNAFAASSVTAHNDLSGLQGGTGGEYYHLTNTEHTYLTTNDFALVGTYTNSYVPRWNATLNTLESGIIQDNGSNGSIGISIQPDAKFAIYSNTASANRYALEVGNNATLTTTSPNVGIYGYANGSVSGSTWYNAGGVFSGGGNDSVNYGIRSIAGAPTVGENIAGYFSAAGGASDYALQLVDGSQGAGKVLTSDANGKATWQAPSTGVSIGDAIGSSIGNSILYVDGSGNLANDADIYITNNPGSDVSINLTDGGGVSGSYQAGYANITSQGFAGRLDMITYSNSGPVSPVLLTVRSRGTQASPSAVLIGDTLGEWSSYGYYDSVNTSGAGIIRFVAAENWSGSGVGTQFQVATMLNGSVPGSGLSTRILIDGAGDVSIGNFKFDGDQTVGSGQDNYVLTYDNATGLISLEAPSGGGGGGGGGLTPTYQSGTTYTASNGDLVVAANAALVITLPTAAADITIGVKSVVVPTAMEVRSAAAGETVDGQDRSVTGEAINNQWDYMEFVSYTPDGGSTYDWLIR